MRVTPRDVLWKRVIALGNNCTFFFLYKSTDCVLGVEKKALRNASGEEITNGKTRKVQPVVSAMTTAVIFD